MRRARAILLVAAVSTVIALAAWDVVRRPAPGPAARGAELFSSLGCVACHGTGATGGIANPHSKEREIPGFTGGTAMMYVESEAEIREWILDGRPRRLEGPLAGEEALIKMPAYRGKISDQELDDLVAFYRAVAGFNDDIPEDAAAGRKIARRLGCVGCHGAGGQIGAQNPGSFKGYVPGWTGDDFAELVRDDEELKAWILDGTPPRLKEDAVARAFLERQLLQMPAYRDVLEEGELASLIAFIRWLRCDEE